MDHLQSLSAPGLVSRHFDPLRAFLAGHVQLVGDGSGPWEPPVIALFEWQGWDPEPVLLVWDPGCGRPSMSCLSEEGGFPAAIKDRLEQDLERFRRELGRGSGGRVLRRFRLMRPDRARLFAECQLRAYKNATS